jgi:hypothetical protein
MIVNTPDPVKICCEPRQCLHAPSLTTRARDATSPSRPRRSTSSRHLCARQLRARRPQVGGAADRQRRLQLGDPGRVAKTNADKEARWGDAIRKEGLLSALHPKWHLRTDDGKPPRHQARPRERPRQPAPRPADAPAGAPAHRAGRPRAAHGPRARPRRRRLQGGRRATPGVKYIDVMRSRSATWFQGAMADRAAVRGSAARRAHPDRQPGQHARRRHLRRPFG